MFLSPTTSESSAAATTIFIKSVEAFGMRAGLGITLLTSV